MKVPSEYTDPFREYHLLGRIAARVEEPRELAPSREGLYLVEVMSPDPDASPWACIDAVYRDPDTGLMMCDGDPADANEWLYLYLAPPDW